MPMFTPEKALRSLRKTPIILKAVLEEVSAERAQSATDGADGWSVVEVVGHLYDWEQIFFERAKRMLNEEIPVLAAYNQEELVKASDYAHRDVAVVLAKYGEGRQRFIELMNGLNEEEWARRGDYPGMGIVTVLEQTTNMALHDINHIEQIVHTLAS